MNEAPRVQGDPILDTLDRAERTITALRPNHPRAGRVAALKARLGHGQFHLAIVGQFKRGKSSVVNALLGSAVLPTGVIPLTAVPTFIQWANRPTIRVRYGNGKPPELFEVSGVQEIRRVLFRFVAEEGNPRNHLEVDRVDLFFPSSFLEGGLVLIDTPGVGSTLAHNTRAAKRVLPECDAGLFVVSADPPITEAEIAYLDDVSPHVTRLMFALNKIDHLQICEHTSALTFLTEVLQERLSLGAAPTIFCLSAQQALEAKSASDAQALEKSGLPKLERYLREFLANDKVLALRRAVAQKALEAVAAEIADVTLLVRALEMPIADLERRTNRFNDILDSIEPKRTMMADLLAGDRRRSVKSLEACAEQLRRNATDDLLKTAQNAWLTPAPAGDGRETADATLAAAIPNYFEARLRNLSKRIADEIEAMLALHRGRVDELVASIRQNAADLFDIGIVAREPSEAIVISRDPYWITQNWEVKLVVLPKALIERVLPAGIRQQRVRRRIAYTVSELVQRNVENLRWALLQAIDDSFRRFNMQVDERIGEVLEATKGAIKAALDLRRQESNRSQAELERLQSAGKRLQALRIEFGCYVDELHKTVPVEINPGLHGTL
jgi:GTPase Era involved in 16S rRNA processing